MRRIVMAMMLCMGFSGIASASSFNFIFSGTAQNGVYIELNYGADPAIAPGNFTVYKFDPIVAGSSCTSTYPSSAQCFSIEFLANQSLIPNHAPVDVINVTYYKNQPAASFWFGAGTHVNTVPYPTWTLPESPGSGWIISQFVPNGTPDDGLEVPEPSSLALLGIGLVGVAFKRKSI